jgi:urease accessory protein
VYAEPSPSSPVARQPFVSVVPGLQRSRGRAAVRFKLSANGRTMLADLEQSAPCRAMVPRGDDLPTVAFISTCGGLTSGDAVTFNLELGAGTQAIATTQAAEKIYRAREGDAAAQMLSRVVVGEGAYAEWLPQETILFDGSRLERQTCFDLAADARVLACELRVLGRAAHGELFSHGFLADRIEVRRAGNLEWVDALRLGVPQRYGASGNVELLGKALHSPAGFGGYPAIGTVFYAAPDAPAHLAKVREILEGEAGAMAAATAWDNILVTRILAADVFDLRRAAARFITGFRAHLGQAPVMPRFWSL